MIAQNINKAEAFMKKLISIVLTAVMLLYIFPLGIFAAPADEHEIKLELVKDSTTFDGKEVLRVDLMYKSGTEKPIAQIVNLRYDATKLAPLAQATGADASAYATNFSVSMSGAFTKNNYTLTDPIFGDMPSEVMFYTLIQDGVGYINWVVTEPNNTPEFSELTRISSIFFGLKEGVSFAAFPQDAITFSDIATDKSITHQSSAVMISNGVDDTYIWGSEDSTEDTLTVTPAFNDGDGVTYASGTVDAATPIITAQPSDASYIKDATAAPLTVTASTTDDGTLTYEWFKSSTDSTTGGTSVGTGMTYTPQTGTIGVTYYYVVVTNTNNSVTGAETAQVTSSTARIEITEDPDLVALNNAKNEVESATYDAVAHADYTTEDALGEYVQSIAYTAVGTDFSVSVNKISYTAPIDGTAADADVKGTDGTYKFTVTLTKNGKNVTTSELSLTVTATAFDGITDAQAVAAAKAGLTSGTVEVPYGSDQDAKTAAVQAYVNAELEKIADAAGVTATVSHKSDNTYTVALSKGAATDSKELDMTVNIGEDPDIAIVAAAKSAAETAEYTNMAQSAASNTDAIKTQLKACAVSAIDNSAVTVEVVEVSYTQATAGDSANVNGTNGLYTFKIKVSKGIRFDETNEKSITIIATQYTGVSDVDAVAAAKAAIVDAEIVVPFGTSDEGKRAAVQKHFDDLMTGTAAGVVVVIESVDGDQYTVKLSKNDTVDTKTVSITVRESADPDIEAVANAKAAAESAVYADIAQATANTESAVKAIVRAIAENSVANSNIKVTVDTVGTFIPAEAGSAATTKEGVNGSYTFTVTVTAAKGTPTETASEKTVKILATEFNGVLDKDAVEAAKAALVDGEVIVSIGADEDERNDAVNDYINSALVGDAKGVKAKITDKDGDEYTVELTKGSAYTSKKLTITVKEADPEKLDVPTGLSFKNGVAKWNKVNSAAKYTVRLYADDSIVTSVTLTDTSYDFTSDLEKDTAYVFTVEAIGDGIRYLDSGESVESGTYIIRSEEESEFMSEWELSMMMLHNRRFTITATTEEGGSVTPAGKSVVMFGGGITYKIVPDVGYEIDYVLVDGKNVGAVDSYSFRNVTKNHTIFVEFKESGWNNPFVDVFETDTYYDAVAFVYENGLFNGVSLKEFAPDTTMTRAMFVTVLGRLAGVDADVYTETTFTDVVVGEWYAPYVEWAASAGIVNGYGNGTFGVDDEITVEQAVVILARYAEYAGIDTDDGAELDDYSDADEVADWAVEQMEWIVDRGIYEGMNGKLEPKTPAKRSLIAKLLYVFVDELGE